MGDYQVLVVGGREIRVPKPQELAKNIKPVTKKVRKKGRQRGEDTDLTNLMVYTIQDLTENLVHFIPGIGRTEKLADMLEEEGHQLVQFTNRKNRSLPYHIVAGPQVTYDYMWEPSERFPQCRMHEGVKHTRVRINPFTYRIKIFRYKTDAGDKDKEKKEPKGGKSYWSDQAWRQVQLENRLKKMGCREPIELAEEDIRQMLVSANILPYNCGRTDLAEQLMKAIIDILAVNSIHEVSGHPNLYAHNLENYRLPDDDLLFLTTA